MKKDEFDVVVLGAGLAGMYTAMNINPKYKIGMFAKDKIDKHQNICFKHPELFRKK